MPAAAGATKIPVSAISAPLPAGALLNFSQTKAVLVTDAPAGATLLEVEPLGAALPSGAQVSWSGEIIVRSQLLTRIALAQPLSSAIPEGAVLGFPSGNVILAQEAVLGSTYLYAHPVEQPTVGAIATYTQEFFQLPYSSKQLLRGGTKSGGNLRIYPYSPTKPALILTGGSRCGGTLASSVQGGTRSSGLIALGMIGGTKTSGGILVTPAYLAGGTRSNGTIDVQSSPTAAALLGPEGMTQIVNGNADDDNVNAGDIGLNFPFYDATYRSNIFIGSNGYVTFGFGSNQYSGITTTAPGRGLFICARDRSYQQVYVKQDNPGRDFRVRYEGGTSTSGTPGSPTMEWEVTLQSNGNIQLVTGILNSTEGASFLTSGNGTDFTNFVAAANSSYSFIKQSNTQYTIAKW